MSDNGERAQRTMTQKRATVHSPHRTSTELESSSKTVFTLEIYTHKETISQIAIGPQLPIELPCPATIWNTSMMIGMEQDSPRTTVEIKAASGFNVGHEEHADFTVGFKAQTCQFHKEIKADKAESTRKSRQRTSIKRIPNTPISRNRLKKHDLCHGAIRLLQSGFDPLFPTGDCLRPVDCHPGTPQGKSTRFALHKHLQSHIGGIYGPKRPI